MDARIFARYQLDWLHIKNSLAGAAGKSMSKILVLDTSREKTLVAISLTGQVETLASEKSRHAAQEVLPLIHQLLEKTGTSLAQVDAIAVVTGPGSFTGLRIGIGVAQGLGASLDVPLLGLSSLALLAFAANAEYGCSHCLVLQQARVNELYIAAYQVDAERGCILLGRERVIAEQELETLTIQLIDSAPGNQQWGLIGDAWLRLERAAQLALRLGIQPSQAHFQNIEHACALAMCEFQLGKASRELLLPNYVKEELDYS